MSKGESRKGEGKRHYPPAYYRYQEKKPGIFLRLSKEQKKVLDKYKGKLSYGQAIANLISEHTKEQLDYEDKKKRHVEDLKESEPKVGALLPVLTTKYGIIDGKLRKEAFPDWREKNVEIDNPYNYYKVMAGVNLHIEKPKEWFKDILNKAAEELVKMGKDTVKGEVYSELVDSFGLRKEMIDELLDSKYRPDPMYSNNKSLGTLSIPEAFQLPL